MQMLFPPWTGLKGINLVCAARSPQSLKPEDFHKFSIERLDTYHTIVQVAPSLE
jgi:hypothetical protein